MWSEKIKIPVVLAVCFVVLVFSYIGTVRYPEGPAPIDASAQSSPEPEPSSEPDVAPARKLLKVMTGADRIDIFSIPQNRSGVLITTINKKPWGTWNIGYWAVYDTSALPSNRYKLLAGTGSDWEYVWQVARDPADATIFSGGNHGNERAESVTLTNLDDGTVIDLTAGAPRSSFEANALSMTELTSLYSDSTYSYKYAEATRLYTFKGEVIELETEVRFTADIYAGMSYMCMFPVIKSVGPSIRFVDSGDIFTVGKDSPRKVGLIENSYGYEKTRSVIIGGGTPYSFRISIGNDAMVDDFRNKCKVFYWDVNKYGNKLYFSKYDDESPVLIKAGEVQLLQARWEIITGLD